MTTVTVTPRRAAPPRMTLAELVERHPLRRRILGEVAHVDLITGGDGASPVEVARRLREPLGVVAYHVRELVRHDGLELIRTRPVRGAREHFYRRTPAGDAVIDGSPLEVAIRALETILAEDGRATVASVYAEDALGRLARRHPLEAAAAPARAAGPPAREDLDDVGSWDEAGCLE